MIWAEKALRMLVLSRICIAVLLTVLCICPAHAQVDGSLLSGGAVRVGASTTACNSSATGAIRYNSSTTRLEFCDSTGWVSFGSTAALDDLDDVSTDYTTDHNMFMGYQSGLNATSGNQYNLMVGMESGKGLTTGSRNTGIGYRVMRAVNTGSDNVGFGYQALRDATGGSGNVGYGGFSLLGIDTGNYNVAVGKQPLYNNTASYNVGIGYTPIPNHGSNNVANGRETLGATSANGNSVAIGYLALTAATGGNNTAFGYQAGDALTTGSNNVLIGYDIDAPSVSHSNFISIGNIIFVSGADGTGTTLSSGGVGIGLNNPASAFVVQPPAAETIAAAATITADSCGTIKKITSGGGVTTNTTNTFTSPTSGYDGCCMDVFNTGANTITLDQNAKFKTSGGANVSLTAGSFVRVCSNGTNWYQLTAVVTPS